ncbi:hypothetical protein [Mycobacterium sp.]|uniref:hypothetical protein n=1 Tax=Mycobacterium sp. TaxID=1785 RepID=UPI00260239F3|nr:hypothetical protein [Mycobacterium sp.]
MSDVALPLPMPDVATALAQAHDRHAAGQRLFQFLIDVDDVDLREEGIQQRLFDSDARDATVVVVAEVHSLAFTRAATSLADALGGALADLEQALPDAVVVFITIEQTIDHPLGLTTGR